jgi:hypothetical protein
MRSRLISGYCNEKPKFAFDTSSTLPSNYQRLALQFQQVTVKSLALLGAIAGF